MSHQVKLKVQIKNLETLKKTLTELGYSYRENGRINDYLNNPLQNVSLLVNTGRHDDRVGFQFNEEDQSYDLVGDFYQTGVDNNKFRNSVKQLYVSHEIKSLVRRKRYTVIKEEKLANGKILIRTRAMAA